MNLLLNFGSDNKNNDIFIDLKKENIKTILLTGETGTGKSILHEHLYDQLIANNSADELQFVFFDMTAVDFSNWKGSPYLKLPVIHRSDHALDAFEMILKQPSNDKLTIIHIEECDIVYENRQQFEKAWQTAYKTENIIVIFSTSRPSDEVFTDSVLNSSDLKISFKVPSAELSKRILGFDGAEKLIGIGEKIIVYKNKHFISKPLLLNSKPVMMSGCEMKNFMKIDDFEKRSKPSIKEKLSNFFSKHSQYLSIIWGISIAIASVSAFIDWLKILFEVIQAGSFWGFVLAIVLQTFIMAWYTITGAIIAYLVILVITVIPYLIIRGLSK